MTNMPPKKIVDHAIKMSKLSPCRSKRGVVIFDGERILSAGHNHKPPGFTCDGSLACKANCSKDAIHAEEHAIMSARAIWPGVEMLHVKTVNGELVPSGGPSCLRCSVKIVAVDIARMWLYHESGWRAYDAHEFHRLSGAYIPPTESIS